MGIVAPVAPTRIRLLEPPPGGSPADLASATGTSPLLAHLLALRGVSTPGDAYDFLSPRLETIHDPFLLPDAELAIDRICHAIDNKQLIFVHGDYDVDGITSAALYTRVLSKLGARVHPFVPHRRREGYGVQPATIDMAHSMGAGLVLTCDCGVSAAEACERSKAIGLDLVVTDHHTCPDQLPCAFAIVDPMRPDSTYPFRNLAGVGVAYKVCQGVCARKGIGIQKLHGHFLDLVTIGTIADSALLLGENRAYVYHGLNSIAGSRKVGLKSLLFASQIAGQVTPRQISFQIAPRINAVGRLDEPSLALELMLTEDQARAGQIAQHMCRCNDDRRQEQERIFNEALEALTPEDAEMPVLVVVGRGWNKGIVGIVAGKLSELFYKPCIVANLDGGFCRGSGRSIPGFSLADAIKALGPSLLQGGGHDMAAGVSFAEEDLREVRKALCDLAEQWLTEEQRARCIDVEALVDPSEWSLEAAREIMKMAPYGYGNNDPLFLSEGVRLKGITPMSEGTHFRAGITGAPSIVRVLGWDYGQWAASASESAEYSICYTVAVNTYRGDVTVDLVLQQPPMM